MAESKLRKLSTDFAIKIIKLCETIEGYYLPTRKAGLHRQIALKWYHETEYWLEKSDIVVTDTAIDLYNQCGTIRRILIASINTAKGNKI